MVSTGERRDRGGSGRGRRSGARRRVAAAARPAGGRCPVRRGRVWSDPNRPLEDRMSNTESRPATEERPATARVAVIAGVGGPFTVEVLDVPEVRRGGSLLRMALSGVCATDAHIFKGDWPSFRFPAILGHENCAHVVALGPGVESDFLGEPLAPGDLVVPRVASCGRCWYCLVGGAARWCPNRTTSPGTRGGLSLNGGWAEHMYLESDALQLFKTGAPPGIAVLTEPMATCVGAIDRAELKLGETVVVQGAGPIGLMTAAC